MRCQAALTARHRQATPQAARTAWALHIAREMAVALDRGACGRARRGD